MLTLQCLALRLEPRVPRRLVAQLVRLLFIVVLRRRPPLLEAIRLGTAPAAMQIDIAENGDIVNLS